MVFREFEAACGGIVVEKAFNVAEHEVPVPLKITLYRILQEATNNIVKHAGADRVRVRLERVDEVLHLLIEDNGCGFRSGQHRVCRRPGQRAGTAQHDGARIVFRRNLPPRVYPRARYPHRGIVAVWAIFRLSSLLPVRLCVALNTGVLGNPLRSSPHLKNTVYTV